MQGFLAHAGLTAERQIVIDRLASAPALNELMAVLAGSDSGGSPSSPADVLRRLSPETGMEVLAALKGGSARPRMWADRRPSLLGARPRT